MLRKQLWEASFQKGDGLLFGNEGGGVPEKIPPVGTGQSAEYP